MSAIHRNLPVYSFKSQEAWDAWLASEPSTSKGVWVKLAKKSSGIATVSQPQAIVTAICHGWIDGQLDKWDENYWLVRFTPRKPKSKWSEKNRTTALETIEQGLMKPAGLKEIERAKADGRWDAAYAPQSTASVPDDLTAALAKNKGARNFFEKLDSANRYAVLYRVHEAKKPQTRTQLIAKFVAMLSRGETIHPVKNKIAR